MTQSSTPAMTVTLTGTNIKLSLSASQSSTPNLSAVIVGDDQTTNLSP